MKKAGKQTGYFLAVTIFLIFTLGPIIWTFILSVTPEYDMFSQNSSILPEKITLLNWRGVFNSNDSEMIFKGIKNSLTAAVRTLCIGIPIVAVTAYVLTRIEFKGRKVIKNILLITMVIPRLTILIPVYRIFSVAHILDNPTWLSIVYVSSFLPMTTWLMSNYFAGIPKELEEAAMVDGCGKIKAFYKIILPLSLPILFSAGLIIFLNTWNQFQIPLILTASMDTKPIAVVASEFMAKDKIEYGITVACGLMAIFPPVLMAMLFRKALIGGMMKGAEKG